MPPSIVVFGAGPGLGRSVCRQPSMANIAWRFSRPSVVAA